MAFAIEGHGDHDTNIEQAGAVMMGSTANNTNIAQTESVAIEKTSRDTNVGKTNFFANDNSNIHVTSTTGGLPSEPMGQVNDSDSESCSQNSSSEIE